MADDPDDVSSGIVRTLTSSFSGDDRPATLEDVARVYARILSIADLMVNLLEVAGTSNDKKPAAIDRFQSKFHGVVEGIADDAKALMLKRRGGDNG